MKIEIICSWCDRSMGSKDCEVPDPAEILHPITHGICPECFKKEMAEIDALDIDNTDE